MRIDIEKLRNPNTDPSTFCYLPSEAHEAIAITGPDLTNLLEALHECYTRIHVLEKHVASLEAGNKEEH